MCDDPQPLPVRNVPKPKEIVQLQSVIRQPVCALFYVIVEVEEIVQFEQYNAVLAQTNDGTW